jgi:chromosome segregation ATPase
MTNGGCLLRKALCILPALVWSSTIAFGRQQSGSPPASQSSQQSSSQTQSPPPQQKEESPADAAKKTEKEKPKPKKVYTEEDLAGLRGNGVSVVGDDKPAGPAVPGTSKPNEKKKPGVEPMSGQDEEYWRGKARALLDRIAATEQRIEQKKEEIKKLGSGGFDITTGMKDNIAYIHDRNAQLQELEKHKADLQKQLDDLQDEGRKVGAPSSWFR